MPLPEPFDPRAAGALRRSIARRVADAHEPLLPGAITAMVFGSSAEGGLADTRSDIDMSIVFEQLPDEAEFASPFVLDGELLALLAAHAPQIDLTTARERRSKFSLTQTTR
jgi:predicted nucleotidyltransferase